MDTLYLDRFYHHIERRPEAVAFRMGDEAVTFGALDERAELIERLQTLRPNHPMDYLNWAEELGKKNDRFDIQLDAIKVFMRDVMRYQAGGDKAPIMNRDMRREVERCTTPSRCHP